jgi:hypothetical protein
LLSVLDVNEFSDAVVVLIELLYVFNEDVCVSNVDLDKNIDTLVTKLLVSASVTNEPVCPPNVFHFISFEDVYAVKELAVTCKAENDTNADAVNVFNALMLVEAPQLPESSSIEVNLLSTDALNVLTDEVVAYEPVLPPITSNLSLTLLLNEFNEFIEAVCELFVDKAVDADVLNEDADTNKLPLSVSNEVNLFSIEPVFMFNDAVTKFIDEVVELTDAVCAL